MPIEAAPAGTPIYYNDSSDFLISTSYIRYNYSNAIAVGETNSTLVVENPNSYWVTTRNITVNGFTAGAAEEFPEESLKRAKDLLESAMDEEQRKEAAEKSQFRVRSSKGKMFRIRTTHASGNVEELDEHGEPVARFCAHPRGVPLGDQLLAQKLALETDEEAFLAVANCHWRRSQPEYAPLAAVA